LNLELQRADRVMAFPFFFLDGSHAMNVKPLHYEWPDFYGQCADLSRYAFTGARVWRRLMDNSGLMPRALNLARGYFALKRVNSIRRIHKLLGSDPQMRRYFEGKSRKLPRFYVAAMRKAMGPLWQALPPGALDHDPNAYRKEPTAYQVVTRRVRTSERRAMAMA
jgi:hypothetical protein